MVRPLCCNSSILSQETWPASSPSCCRIPRLCHASQSSASGWSYLPGPSPCPDSLTISNHQPKKNQRTASPPTHPGCNLHDSSGVITVFEGLNSLSMVTSTVSKWMRLTSVICKCEILLNICHVLVILLLLCIKCPNALL